MRAITSSRSMYVAQFAANVDERRDLFHYLTYLEDIEGTRVTRELGESAFWTELTSETVLGFSSDRVILRSGHAFAHARITAPIGRLGVGTALGNLLAAACGRPKGLLAGFCLHHSAVALDDSAMGLSPGAYLRGGEALNQASAICSISNVSRFREIGQERG